MKNSTKGLLALFAVIVAAANIIMVTALLLAFSGPAINVGGVIVLTGLSVVGLVGVGVLGINALLKG